MKHPFRWVALAVGVAVLLFSIVLAVNVTTDPRAELNTSRLLGKPAPEITLELLDGEGKTVSLASHKGKDIVVLETSEDIDKNKDGFITLEEYISQLCCTRL